MGEERFAEINRETKETEINLRLGLDSAGVQDIDTGIPFFDHMLHSWAKHGGFHLELFARGDLDVDYHHTVEDTGICLGQALDKCLGEKKGIGRFGYAVIPMDEALVLTSIDISGRGFLAYDLNIPSSKVGNFDTELVEEFLRGFSYHGKITLHVRQFAGRNCHHIIESMFKSFSKSLRQAVNIGGDSALPSTKGLL